MLSISSIEKRPPSISSRKPSTKDVFAINRRWSWNDPYIARYVEQTAKFEQHPKADAPIVPYRRDNRRDPEEQDWVTQGVKVFTREGVVSGSLKMEGDTTGPQPTDPAEGTLQNKWYKCHLCSYSIDKKQRLEKSLLSSEVRDGYLRLNWLCNDEESVAFHVDSSSGPAAPIQQQV
ncbi:hypothetical protein Bbelb_243010 [Branchiostoma belcheri]|nr:hypothetical protein Bbelb_243010 [Branchiostoma belcheri]